MKKKRIKPSTCVKPLKFGEVTVTVKGRRIPESKEEEYREWHSKKIDPIIDEKIKPWLIVKQSKQK